LNNSGPRDMENDAQEAHAQEEKVYE